MQQQNKLSGEKKNWNIQTSNKKKKNTTTASQQHIDTSNKSCFLLWCFLAARSAFCEN